jgi:hypothetical protein
LPVIAPWQFILPPVSWILFLLIPFSSFFSLYNRGFQSFGPEEDKQGFGTHWLLLWCSQIKNIQELPQNHFTQTIVIHFISFHILLTYGSAVLLLDLGRFFSFLILYTVGMTPWTGDQPVVRPLPTQNNANTE